MRSVVVLCAIASSTLASNPLGGSKSGIPALKLFVMTVCSVPPDLIPSTIPPACGRNVAKPLCQWARLSEDMFIDLAIATVTQIHNNAKTDSNLKDGLKENIDSTGLDDEGAAYWELTKRYYYMIRSFDECKALL